MYNVAVSFSNSDEIPQCGWFAHEALRIYRSHCSDYHPNVLRVSKNIGRLRQPNIERPTVEATVAATAMFWIVRFKSLDLLLLE